ncbi:MAG: molybdate ABC transporter permease subunit [Legionellales bacterium]|nr:molybdate ABC transporter permease subunit [Legionellales bacterium]
MDWNSIVLSFRLATVTTMVLLALCIPLALWFSKHRSRTKTTLEALCSLPLILPPTVMGFYLLLVMSPKAPIGRIWSNLFGQDLVFSFNGLVLGSVICSFPFVLKPIQNAFERVNKKYIEMAATLGYSPRAIFWRIHLPLSFSAILSAAVLGFAHTLSEFGVVLMLGGNIPGKTRTVSIAIYDAVEGSNYLEAHRLSLLMLGLSFFILCLVYREYAGGPKR